MADSIKSKSVYSGIMNRWIFGATADNKKSAIFNEGYDDPTYMTFKIEFGDWGASVLGRDLIQNGITEFALSFNDYDQLPIGLLNCPYEGMKNQEMYWQTNANENYKVFNNVKFYSAFQYLRSRNEDTRALYLYYFVNGLYEIQHDYPFLFKKISGLGNLEKIDYAGGQRLKTPAKITVECFESLDLKIRTLFEFYRKAAWDDVYQRWILPENMREFKMIIYVFERRIFQDTEMFNVNDQKHMKMSYGSLNADIPVKAYECMPCEFDISESMSWNDGYSSATENAEEVSKLVINVKNVKTYFRNKLIKGDLQGIYRQNGGTGEYDIQEKIDSIMIYDLVDNIERTTNGYAREAVANATTSNFTNLSVNGARALFLNKNILLENEEANAKLKSYIWGHSLGGAFESGDDNAKNAIQKSNKQLIGLSEHNTGHDKYQAMVESYAKDSLLQDNAQSDYQYQAESRAYYSNLEDNAMYRGGWVYSLSQSPSYDPTRTFWENLGDNITNVLTGSRKFMLVSGAANLQYIDNCLIDSEYIPTDAFEKISDYKNGLGNIKPQNRMKSGLNPVNQVTDPSDPIQSEKDSKYNYNNSEYRQQIVDDKLNNVNEAKQSSDPIVSQHEMKYYRDRYWVHNKSLNPVNQVTDPSDPIQSEKDSKYNYKDLDNVREIPEHQFNELKKEREIPSQEFTELKNRTIPQQDFETLDDARNLPEQEYRELDKEREIKEQDFNIIRNTRKIDKQDYRELDKERELPGQEYKDVDKERELPKQEYKKLNKERKLPDQTYKELEEVRNTDSELMKLLLVVRSLPGFKNLTIEDIRKIPKQDLLELKEAEERSIPIYNANKSVILESIKNVEGTNIKLLELDKDNKTLEEQTLEMLQQNQALQQFKISETPKETPEEKADKLKKILAFTKDFVENKDTIKKAYVSNIMEMKSELKNVTKDIVNKLPINDTHIVKKGEKDNNNIDSALMSQNDVDQINCNMKFLAINDNDIEKLSFQTLITIQDDLSKELKQSKAAVGLTEVVKDSVATNPNRKIRNNAKNSVISESQKNKMDVIY